MPRRSSARRLWIEPRYPGWYIIDGLHEEAGPRVLPAVHFLDQPNLRAPRRLFHGHYHRSCIDRVGYPYVLEQDPDDRFLDGHPCPLCPESAKQGPPAPEFSVPDDEPRCPGWARTETGTLWGAFHPSCLEHAVRGGEIFRSEMLAISDDAPCPLCPIRVTSTPSPGQDTAPAIA